MAHHHHQPMGNIILPWAIIRPLHHQVMGNIILPWLIISSLRLISSYRLGAETKSQKAQARYKYGPIFRMSVVPRATGPSSWNPRSSIFRFHKSLQPNAHSDLCTTPYFRFFRFSLFQPHRAHRERFILTDALMFIYFLAEVDVYILNHQDTSVIILIDDLSTTLQDPRLSPYQIAHRPKGINFHVFH
jgi:hypothetical protein